MNKVSEIFIQFLKKVRTQAKVNTRELALVAGKSNAYVSILESGKIKTIDFETAYAMLEYINKKKTFLLEADIFELLTDHFHIYPQDYWDKVVEEQERTQEQQIEELKRINDKLDIITAFVDKEELADLLLLLTQAKLLDDEVGILNDCFKVIRDQAKNKALYTLVDILSPSWGRTGGYPDNHPFYVELNSLLIKYKFEESK